MLNRVRLPFYLSKPQYPAEEDIYLKGNGRRVVLKSIVSKVMDGKTDYMPYKLHERLTIALRHDEVNIENENFTGSVRMSGAYDINWIDFLDYPVAQATFKAFEEEFVARSNKCDICDTSDNLSLEDDAFDETLDEGTEYTINVAENDNICCDTPVFSILSFDVDYIDTIDIDQTGEVTFTLKTPLSSAPDKLLFTYKVTCIDGTEDTADVYATVEGTTTPLCEAPTGLELTLVDASSAEIQAEWVEPGGGAPTDGYEWQLLNEAGDTVISFGTTSSLTVNINSLDCDQIYGFKVRAVCDVDTGDYSAWLNGDISVPSCVGVEITAVYSTNPATHCSLDPNTVYTNDGFIFPGKTIYTDAGLTVILTGFTFISDLSIGTIYNLNPLTGVVGLSTGNSC